MLKWESHSSQCLVYTWWLKIKAADLLLLWHSRCLHTRLGNKSNNVGLHVVKATGQQSCRKPRNWNYFLPLNESDNRSSKHSSFVFIPTCSNNVFEFKESLKKIRECVFVVGPEPEDQPLLHPDQQHCLPACRQPLLHPPHGHVWPGRQQGLRLWFRHQPHLNTGKQRQRDYRWDLQVC